MLSDVLAFDIQVYDPEARVLRATDDPLDKTPAVTPSDPGYPMAIANSARLNIPALSKGAFVDLGYGFPPKSGTRPFGHASSSFRNFELTLQGNFWDLPLQKSQLRDLKNANATYCTWCDEYERDGFNQDGDSLTDEGTNGVDDKNPIGKFENGVDDVTELETMPPYPHPLRGITVKLRVMEFNTRQVRQTSVAVDFLPE